MPSRRSRQTAAERMPNVSFYRGSLRSDAGRLEEVLKWKQAHASLEEHPSYVQWLFPNYFPSQHNADAHPLTPEEAQVFCDDFEIARKYLRAYDLFLDVLGLQVVDWQTGRLQVIPEGGDERLRTALVVKTQNRLRLRRVFASLAAVGFFRFMRPLLTCLEQAMQGPLVELWDCPSILDTYLAYCDPKHFFQSTRITWGSQPTSVWFRSRACAAGTSPLPVVHARGGAALQRPAKMACKGVSKGKCDQAATPNVNFYSGELRSSAGFISEVHAWRGAYPLLERHHAYVQWLFPNFFSSQFNADSHALTPTEADTFRKDLTLAMRYLQSYELFLDFLGLQVTDWKTGELRLHPDGGDERLREALVVNPHNQLRIRRLFASLAALGFRPFMRPLLSCLREEREGALVELYDRSDLWDQYAAYFDPELFFKNTQVQWDDRGESVWFRSDLCRTGRPPTGVSDAAAGASAMLSEAGRPPSIWRHAGGARSSGPGFHPPEPRAGEPAAGADARVSECTTTSTADADRGELESPHLAEERRPGARCVSFSVTCGQTKHGQQVRLVGNCPELGCWEPERGLLLTTTHAQFPRWTLEGGAVLLKPDAPVEYKYVICDRDGQLVCWEALGRDKKRNRLLNAASFAGVRVAAPVVVHDTFGAQGREIKEIWEEPADRLAKGGA